MTTGAVGGTHSAQMFQAFAIPNSIFYQIANPSVAVVAIRGSAIGLGQLMSASIKKPVSNDEFGGKMIDGLIEGLVGGLSSLILSRWLKKFKYWIVFLIGFLSTPLCGAVYIISKFGFSVFVHGLPDVWNDFKKDHWLLILINVIIGLIFVFVAFNGTLLDRASQNSIKKKKEIND